MFVYKKVASLLIALILINIHTASADIHSHKMSTSFISISDFIPSLDGTEIYGISDSDYSSDDTTLYVIDAITHKATKKIKLQGINEPNRSRYTGMILSPDGNTLYMAASTKIIKIDLINKEISAVISTGKGSSDHCIDISGDGLTAVSADLSGHDDNNETYIHLIDTQKNILLDAIPKGEPPVREGYHAGFNDLIVDKLTNKVYLISNSNNHIAILDLNTKKLQLNAVPLSAKGGSIRSMSIDSTRGLLYVPERHKNRLDIIDVNAKSVIGHVNFSHTPDIVLLSPDGSRAYVKLDESSEVAVVDTRSRRIIKTINVPYGSTKLRISLDGKRIYTTTMSHRFGDDNYSTVHIVDTQTGKEISSFSVE